MTVPDDSPQPSPADERRRAARREEGPLARPVDGVRVDATGRPMRLPNGALLADDQVTLTAGLRGPPLLEDMPLRMKLAHLAHERIPERVVHARGAGAHGWFECAVPLVDLTRAAPFAAAGKRTPVFVRFSSFAGERGSADTVRDLRGFAVKFYTDEGNWDLVCQNAPVAMVQDAMKYPDLVHAIKPEPHDAMPQATSAHDTFWDFVSLMPECAHGLLWRMSDHALPRSWRTMAGHAVHTFRLVDAQRRSCYVKFHWLPRAGLRALAAQEATRLAGAEPDFHRRDLWEAIDAGRFPEWDLGVQTFGEAEAEGFPFDVLDPTQLVPEELVPIRRVGRLVLDRNPDDHFAEVEQAAFSPANLIPGIAFSDDPLLAARAHAYLDAQLARLGGPAFARLPINAPLVPVHHHARGGQHQALVHRGRVAYDPNSLAGGCPFQAGDEALPPPPRAVSGRTQRRKPPRFAEHAAQAALFWRSLGAAEQRHLVAALRAELSRVQIGEIRARALALLAGIAPDLAEPVAEGLGMPLPQTTARLEARGMAAGLPDVSPGLALAAQRGDRDVSSAKGVCVALLVADGVDADSLRSAQAALLEADAVPRFVGVRLGTVRPADAAPPLRVDTTFEVAPSALWDAVVLPDGIAAQPALASLAEAVEFVREQYRHGKTLLVLGSARTLFDVAMLPPALPDGRPDPGLVFHPLEAGLDGADPSAGGAEDEGVALDQALSAFVAALGTPRHLQRETDPPAV